MPSIIIGSEKRRVKALVQTLPVTHTWSTTIPTFHMEPKAITQNYTKQYFNRYHYIVARALFSNLELIFP